MPMPVAELLDHFVVPVDDLVLAEDFYARVFGGLITSRNGLNVRQRKRGAAPHTFIRVGGKRMGVYLQSEERPKPLGARGLPTYSFTASERGLDEVTEELKRWDVPCEGPMKSAHAFSGRSLFFTDPAGNHYAVYTPSPAHETGARVGHRITGVGFLDLEAPQLGESVEFYEQALGFRLQSQTKDLMGQSRQATLTMPSGQTLILTEAPFSPKGLVMSRKVPGPHIAFYVPAANWRAALDHLNALGVENGDRGAAKERRPGEGGTYMEDPAGYVIQFITDGME